MSSKKVISVPEYSSVNELAKYFEVTPSEIIQKCLGLGVLATINQRLDWDMIQLLAEENNCAVEKLTEYGDELFPLEDTEEDLSKAKPRAPVITVMGHVDHRSEEHTSELQSQAYLVCRLLLEKKKTTESSTFDCSQH